MYCILERDDLQCFQIDGVVEEMFAFMFKVFTKGQHFFQNSCII